MKRKDQQTTTQTYETCELKLAALLLAEIPDASAEIENRNNSIRKTIIITHPTQYNEEVQKLEKDYINKEARTGVYAYNRALNTIRDLLRGN